MTKLRSRSVAGGSRRGNDEQTLVRLFRALTEEQFDYWIACLNEAVTTMGGPPSTFSRDDRQKTVSYWYLLMFLLETYAEDHSPFAVSKTDTWKTDGLLSMRALTREFEGRYKEETIRRYVFDLKKCDLIAIDGRGADAMVQLSAPAIAALADTIRQWVKTFRNVDRRIAKMKTF